ncbi:MAG: phosphopeptide-binding protein [Cytophagales bacterium]|nr:phosphopeptide-binding protein [Cytophagales bacterium]
MKKIIPLVLATLLACSSPKKNTEENINQSQETTSSGISLTKAPNSPQFPNAKLTHVGLEKQKATDSSEAVEYSFQVDNYELGVQTADAETRGLANSGKGQHIHFIVNNGPYSAHYIPGVSNELPWGDYVVLAFLSRSYHESVKSEGAYYVEKLSVGNPQKENLVVDLDAPHMFFSRPKGTYSGEDAKKVMLDFYLVNTNLSPNGNNIRATINGEEFLMDEWAPYYIEDLPMGEVSIKLEFLNAGGTLIDSPFNPVERTVILTE